MERFWNKVDKSGECWLWTGTTDGTFGYGILRRNGKLYRAHRWLFIQLNNCEPEAVLHTCDNPPCVNPAHLVGGTRSENNTDRHKKGRTKGRNPELCKHGHSDWGFRKPTETRKNITRYCKECDRIQHRKAYRSWHDS